MVSENVDPGALTSQMEREMRYAREERERREAAAAQAKLVRKEMPQEPVTAALVVPEESPVEAKEAAETSYRHGRIIVVAVFVVVIFLAWLQERRSR